MIWQAFTSKIVHAGPAGPCRPEVPPVRESRAEANEARASPGGLPQ